MNDSVNNPSYYTDGNKDPDKEIEDLKKAKWYIDRRIKELLEVEAND